MQQTPKNLDKKRADEKLLVSEMIALYCRKHSQRHFMPGVPAAARLCACAH